MDGTGRALLSVTVQSVLYGMYLVTTVAATYSMYHIRARSVKPNKVLLGVSVSLFLSITLHCGLGTASVIDEVIGHEEDPSGPPPDIGQITTVSLTRLGTFYLVNFIMDGLLIYRLYVVYLQDLRTIALPVLATSVSVVSVAVQLALSAQVESWTSNTGAIAKLKFILAPLTLSISAFVCVYCTSFIIYCIFRDGRALQQFRTKSLLRPALYIMIESALVYTVFIILFLVFFLLIKPGVIFLLTFIIPSFIGLNYSLVLIHVSLGLTNVWQTYTVSPSTTRSLGLRQSVALERGDNRPVVVVATEPAEERESINSDETIDWSGGRDTEGVKSLKVAPFNDPTTLV